MPFPKKHLSLKYLFALTLALVFTNCQDDDAQPDSSGRNGGAAYRYQAVLIDLPETQLTQNHYGATLAGQNILLLKVDDHTLVFSVPGDFPLGNAELLVPELDNMKIAYNIVQPALTQSAEATIAPLILNFETYFASIETPNEDSNLALNNYLAFKNYVDTQATAEEKMEIALFYQTNKTVIDDFLSVEDLGGRVLSSNDVSEELRQKIYTKFGKAGAMAIAAALGGAGIGGIIAGPVGAAIGAAAAFSVVYHKNKEIGDDIGNDYGIAYENAVNGVTGENDRNTTSTMSLSSDTPATFTFQIARRTIIATDGSNQNEAMQKYFSSVSMFNEAVDHMNGIINSISIVDFTEFSHETVPSDSNAQQQDVTLETMNNFSFSIAHPNLQLINSTLENEGLLNLKVKIVNTTQPSVSGELRYAYSDALNGFSGKFPIEVENNLQGTWTLTHFDGYAMGIWDNADCPRYRTVSGSITFTGQSFSAQSYSQDQGTWMDEFGQIQCSTMSSGNETFTGNYAGDGSNYLVTNLQLSGPTIGGNPNGHITVVDNNHIEMTLNVIWDGVEPDTVVLKYTRQ
ncbi:hypothetical protein [Flavobacterium caeni]|uniref:Uncharacterized protein n=1 Tax=Flavobacterium caeni TaxID=490189 RepID=A0A1G5IJP9_9FLAO|nr:hypothetical protein [Flavobacterium caeni]SCY75779.1 hypothetical protein SAMN02927903_02265 [Flavobacterium caeni]